MIRERQAAASGKILPPNGNYMQDVNVKHMKWTCYL